VTLRNTAAAGRRHRPIGSRHRR